MLWKSAQQLTNKEQMILNSYESGQKRKEPPHNLPVFSPKCPLPTALLTEMWPTLRHRFAQQSFSPFTRNSYFALLKSCHYTALKKSKATTTLC